jgi:hypothetical protein
MLLIAVCVVTLAAEKQITEAWDRLQGVADTCDWQCVGTSASDVAAAAGWHNGALLLRYFTPDGVLSMEQSVLLPDDVAGGTVSRLVPMHAGAAFLGIYGTNAEKLYLYRITESGEPERLMAVDCEGASYTERTASTRFSEFLYENEALSFAVWTKDDLDCYRCRAVSGVEKTGTAKCSDKNVLSILVSQDGDVLEGGNSVLYVDGQSRSTLVEGESVTHMKHGAAGSVYYLDAVQLGICYVDVSFSASHRLAFLTTTWDGAKRTLTSAALTREGSAIMLLDNMILVRANSDGMRELTGVLQPARSAQHWAIIKYMLIALAAAALLWLLLCGLNRGYASLVILRGSLLVAAAAVVLVAIRLFVLIPAQGTSEMRENVALTSGLLGASNAEQRLNDPRLAGEISILLEKTDAERGHNVRAVLAHLADGQWRTADGRCAETVNDFSPVLADEAAEHARAAVMKNGVYQFAVASEGNVLFLRMEDAGRAGDGEKVLFRYALAGFSLLAVVTLLVLLSLRVDLRRITRHMEKISGGEEPGPLRMYTGDELESMASTVNSLGEAIREQERRGLELENSYRRFVPENVLALLGKQSVQEVDKSTFAARRMAVMMVNFSFPDSLYTDMSQCRLLFDSVNEVIERAASIVARKGGSVFHFSYHGFDVVMEENGEAVSTAVAIQQEVLSFNEQRKLAGLPCVTLQIALDKENVMLGIVGDTSKMEPTMISACLSTVQEMTWLCASLGAGILCTEAIIFEQKEYGSRYMGKCTVGTQTVRVYEVFDGDEFHVRRGKAASLSTFSQGVFDLYAGEASKAKHTFLQLTHKYPQDGGARYYLYLADRMEHDPTCPCSLNADRSE